MAGEKDAIFRLRGNGGDYLLKIAHAQADEATWELVTSALLHLETHAPDLPVQRVIHTLGGSHQLQITTQAGERRWARLTTYLEGEPLGRSPSSGVLRTDIGRSLARTATALETFAHPAAYRHVMWDIARASGAHQMLRELPSMPDYGLLEGVFERFETSLVQRLTPLRRSVLHNDFNTDNVLVTSDKRGVAGVLDFDDLVVTQVVNDLAATAYGYVGTGDDPLGPALDVVRGYHQESPLLQEEIVLIPDLMQVRLVMYLVISEWLSVRSPQNRAYLTRKASLAWEQLRRLSSIPADVATDRILRTCTI
ncbi:phosphotransferase [Arthrobacter sp. Alg241-R88]|uniref:phosphotransferase n=1 Tax=Arthrobacter sp. Alg241-R88 TaxID=2305984 RepID=UPI0013D50A45|nr:phosphotransferase [Arthrobacter sp. Alg241-R88]